MTEKIRSSWANKTIFCVLCASLILTTLAYGTVHQPTLAVFYLTTVALVLLAAVDSFLSGAIKIPKSSLLIPLAAAFIYALIQIIPFGGAAAESVGEIPRTISLDPFATQIAALHFAALLIFFAVLLTYLDRAERLRKLVLIITAFGFIYAFYAILQSFLSPNKIYGIYDVTGGKPFGSFVNRHNFAALMEMIICLPLGLLFVGAIGKDRRLLYLTAIALMGIAIVLSGSRGGLIALVAAIFFLIITTTATKNSKQFALKIGLAAVLLAVIVGGSTLIGGETSLTRINEADTTATTRTHIWSVTLNVIKHNLPFGAGFGAFGVAYTPFDTLSGLERVEQAHNDYLEVLATAGIVGALIGAYFLFALFRIGWRNSRTTNVFRRGVCVGAFAGCFAITIHSLFDFVLHTTAIALMFLTLAALTAVSGEEYADDRTDGESRRRQKRRSAIVTPFDQSKKKVS